MSLYTLRYAHKHGTDVTVYGCGQLADTAADEIIREYVDDFSEKSDEGEEAKAKILKFLDDGEVNEAIDAYEELTNGYETIEIEVGELRTQSTPLTFGEIEIGDTFIGFPLDGDDNGHGGFRGVNNIFEKVDKNRYGHDAVRLHTKNNSTFPDTMKVIRVQ